MIIYLIGFPGSGKLTVAQELSKNINAIILNNNIYNDIILNITNFNNVAIPDNVWDKILEIRKIMLEGVIPISSKDCRKPEYYIFTNELFENDLYDQAVHQSVVNFSYQVHKTILPVILHCNIEELGKRVQSEERKHNHCKITDRNFAIQRLQHKKLFIPQDSLEIDNSYLNPKEVAAIIIKKINGNNFIVNSSTKENMLPKDL